MKNKNNGFTMIEVVIVIGILGIIVAVGYPSYLGYMEKTRRIEAKTLLSEVSGELQRFQTENNTFTDDLTELGYPSATVLSETGLYSLAVSNATANSFLLTAAPVVGKAQENDDDCGSFTVNSVGVKAVTGTAVAADCW